MAGERNNAFETPDHHWTGRRACTNAIMIPRIQLGLAALFAFLSCLQFTLAADDTRWITYQSPTDGTVYLEDNRRPSLFTGNFGDCLGDSSINVTRFDAAYYKDNMTVLFHLAGNSALYNESLMMYIGVYAYGEDRFDLVFNPCNANIYRCVSEQTS